MPTPGAAGAAGGAVGGTIAVTRVDVIDPHILIMMRDVMSTSETAPRLKVTGAAAAGGGGGGGAETCFLPKQLISMSDGTHKPIIDIVVGDMVKTYDMKSEEVKDSPVNKIQTKLHTNVYELHLDNGKILHPTGNHPFLTKEKSWTTIDGHKSNHAGGSEYLNVDDYVYDIDKGWIKVIKIITVDGEHLTYNFIDMEYGTIIADRIVTHNSGTAQAGEQPSTATISPVINSDAGQAGGNGGAGQATEGGGGGGGAGGNGGVIVLITTTATIGGQSITTTHGAGGAAGQGGENSGGDGAVGGEGADGKIIKVVV